MAAQGLSEGQLEAILRFPDQNPNPVMRMRAADAVLTYANPASELIRDALGLSVGQPVQPDIVARLGLLAAGAEGFEVVAGNRTYDLLAVEVPELGFVNVYATDITGAKVFQRFPDDNPNPVFRIDDDARLVYANAASRPLVESFGLRVGERWPAQIARQMLGAADEPGAGLIEVQASRRTYALKPVRIPEFATINVYCTDITAEKVVAKFPDENPNPVLRLDRRGSLLYANEASSGIVAALGLRRGRRVSAALRDAVMTRIEAASREPIELVAGERIFEIVPVLVREFDAINLYGTDVTAARQLAEAKEQTERLLLNILPPPIADRLRAGEQIYRRPFRRCEPAGRRHRWLHRAVGRDGAPGAGQSSRRRLLRV